MSGTSSFFRILCFSSRVVRTTSGRSGPCLVCSYGRRSDADYLDGHRHRRDHGQVPDYGGLARADKASVDKHAAKRGLPLPEHLRPVITDRLVRREKTLQAWSAAGIILGSLSIALVPLFYGWHTGDIFYVPLILGGFGIGSILGRLRLARRGVPSLPGRSQVARPVRPTVPTTSPPAR